MRSGVQMLSARAGFTLVELLVALAMVAILMAGLAGVVGRTGETHAALRERNTLTREGQFALQRMVQAVQHSRRLLLPLDDNPATNWREHVREETDPPSPPEGDSVGANAVLVVTLPLYSDMDGDGTPDADNDGDGRIDEDVPEDATADFGAGVYGLDDDGDGWIDEVWDRDDDEKDGIYGEDPLDGIDDDADGSIDEDPASDMNGDGCPGVCGVDDDADGSIDEGALGDDDEDGTSDEDWWDPVSFYYTGDKLWERTPVPWDITGAGGVTGRDYITSQIADHVSYFRVERVPIGPDRDQRVDLTLELTSPVTGETLRLHTQVRLGSAL